MGKRRITAARPGSWSRASMAGILRRSHTHPTQQPSASGTGRYRYFGAIASSVNLYSAGSRASVLNQNEWFEAIALGYRHAFVASNPPLNPQHDASGV